MVVDEIIVFDPLTSDQLLEIVDLMLFDTQKVLNDKNIIMTVSDSAKKFLLKKGTDNKYGARPLRRSIQRHVEDELSDMLLRGDLEAGQKVSIDYDESQDKLSFKIVE